MILPYATTNLRAIEATSRVIRQNGGVTQSVKFSSHEHVQKNIHKTAILIIDNEFIRNTYCTYYKSNNTTILY